MTTITSQSNRREFYVGEKRWVKISVTDQLEGVQISSVSWAAESPVALIGGSSAIYTYATTNDSVRARFDFAGTTAGTRYTVTATITTADGEEIIESVIVVIKAVPT